MRIVDVLTFLVNFTSANMAFHAVGESRWATWAYGELYIGPNVKNVRIYRNIVSRNVFTAQ